ncbi:adenylate/guanylate cyclase domain-containing protein [Nocardia sp. GTS18]|uniref:adenylate/guanylate cyclase domain-containing protein n=1 Tax=Nocardia sp. GTS18 TaxID=1778064 RepID=UPI0015EFC9CC|nr:adenylate/guanylate cyclase domain-containing protein [Nocardia sp. GTS18]
MDGNYKPYDYSKSSERIKEILNQPSGTFQEVDGLPDRDKLTFTNGFYGTCSALFVDIRGSSALTEKHKRPTLAKIYRAFISEMVALLNSDSHVREVNIVGDCVWAVYNTPFTSHIDDVFAIASQTNTLKKLLNHHFKNKGIDPISIGIGADWGRALMIKAGYSGSGINEVIYMGDVVNRAAHLAHEAGRQWRNPIFVGSDFFGNLNDHNQKLLTSQYVQGLGSIYAGDVVRTDMNDWIDSLE